MLNRLGIPLLALAAMLFFIPAPQAKAGVHFGVFFGAPVAPVYVVPAPAYTPYPYVAPYYGPYPAYTYPAPYYYWGWGGREHWHHHEREYYRGHGWGHESHGWRHGDHGHGHGHR